MPAPRQPLTKLLVQRTSPHSSRDRFLWDSRVPGFGVRIHPSGRRTYVFQYRASPRQQRRVAIGLHGPLTVETAREAAADLYEAVRKGRDPIAERRTAASRQPDTFEHVAEQFIDKHLRGKQRAPSYIAGTRALLDNHVLPRWRGRDINTIKRRDVIELLDGVVDKGAPVAANRVLAAVSALFSWALQRDLIEQSPTARLAMPSAERKRERTLAADEIRAVWAAAGELAYPFGCFFQMALITGQRRTEVAGMRWQDIDEAERTWALPSERTKAGRAHIVPLSPLAIEILEEVQQSAWQLYEPSAGFVFTTRGDRSISGYANAKACLDNVVAERRTKDGLPAIEPWTIHDIRRTVATGLGRLNISRFIIARVLNHADRTVTGIYDRYEYLAEKRRALDAWATYLGNLIAEPAANIVPLHRQMR
jgi:integrase